MKFTRGESECLMYKLVKSEFVQNCVKDRKYGDYTVLFFKMAALDLKQKLENEEIPKDLIYKYLRQIGLGIADLHRSGITHGDLKEDNVLYFP